MRTAAAKNEGAEPPAHETVERPPPGLGHGRWEAPASLFYAVLVVAMLLGLALGRAWIVAPLRRGRRRRPEKRAP